jgi:hypothetical protein
MTTHIRTIRCQGAGFSGNICSIWAEGSGICGLRNQHAAYACSSDPPLKGYGDGMVHDNVLGVNIQAISSAIAHQISNIHPGF